MNSSLWIGLDLGTTGIRCVVFDSNFEVVSSEYMEYPLIYGPENYVEQDPELWFSISKSVIKNAIAAIKNKQDIKGISISSQGISVVATDQCGNPLMPAISWLDRRGEPYLPIIAEKMSPQEIIKRTGKIWSELYTLPKILWLKDNKPDIYESARYLLMPMDYLIARLTGRFCTDHTMAGGTMLYNINTRSWDRKIIENFNIDITKLPEIKEAGTKAGNIYSEITQEIGLPADLPVYVGGQDQKCAAFAAGIDVGKVTISLGTSAALEILLDEPFSDSSGIIPSFSFLFNGHWVAETAINTAGAALRWFVNNNAPDLSYAQLDKQIELDYPSEREILFFPELNRSNKQNDNSTDSAKSFNWPIEPAGVFFGLYLETTRFDMGRAVMESIAFEIERSFQHLKNSFPRLKIDSIRLFGGGANSVIWAQMIADTTNATIELLSTHEMAAAGAAMLAAIGSKEIAKENARLIIKVIKTVEPIKSNHEIMNKKYNNYMTIRNLLYNS
ncbi:MAG TPA: hypothetical protein GXZ43_07800 [Clostridiaceae bacterium]|nr:hypothetical protein [Clostridiaceae bacterium]